MPLFRQPIDVTLLLNVISDFTIISTEGNGIRAEDESTVKLRAFDKRTIEAAENTILRDDTVVVDADGCNELNLAEGID
jgi:hypothetical protein